jgi:CheY-like chemotaxis protein
VGLSPGSVGGDVPEHGRAVHHRQVNGTVLRVVIAEDSVLLREGLVRLIEDSGAVVVARVGDGPSLVAAVVEHRPDVSVVDVRMPPTQRDEGLRAAI